MADDFSELLAALRQQGQPTRTAPIAKPVYPPGTPPELIAQANSIYVGVLLDGDPMKLTADERESVRLEQLRVLREGGY